MIKNIEPLSMAEVVEYIKKGEDNETNVKNFIKKFTKLNPKESKELRKKLEELDLMKLRTEYVVKIIDLMPENPEELNKIFIEVSLNEDETTKILKTIKEFK